MEAAAVAPTRDPARIAELEAEMSQLFLNHLHAGKAVRNPQRTGKLAQEHVGRSSRRAGSTARSANPRVVRLYELELEGTQDARRRADLLLGLGRVLGEKLEELDAAAQRLGEVVRLRPRDEKALELLAGVLREPELDRRGRRRAGGRHLLPDGAAPAGGGRRRERHRGAAPGAGAVPGHAETRAARARLLRRASGSRNWSAIYRERVSGGDRESASTSFTSAAQLAEGNLDDLAEAPRIYRRYRLGRREPGGPAGERLAELYASSHGGEYGKLAEFREKQLGVVEDPRRAPSAPDDRPGPALRRSTGRPR